MNDNFDIVDFDILSKQFDQFAADVGAIPSNTYSDNAKDIDNTPQNEEIITFSHTQS